MRGVTVVVAISLTCAASLHAQGVQVSGGIDARVSNTEPENPDEAVDDSARAWLQGAFLNFRKVWSDSLGDRWIGVAQVDAEDNFDRIRPYQVYLQYKGPLGRWNVRGGHFLLPFGLLTTYDTERLVFQGLERTSLGIRKDTGAEVFGRVGAWDYAVSGTDGLSDVTLTDPRANPVLTGRLAYVRDTLQVGISTLAGRVVPDPAFGNGTDVLRQRRIALDATDSFGPLTMRAEGTLGTTNGTNVGGGVVLGDYALTPRLEVNSRYAYWSETVGHIAGGGLTYQIRTGTLLRVADEYHFNQDRHHAFTVQFYYEFSRQF